MNQIKDFILHLRLNYNFFILSAPFLLGAIFVENVSWNNFIIHFFIIHILLFGGANAYNSYYDKDEGPIGGLKNPPKMSRWMYWASWALQIIGLTFSISNGYLYITLYSIAVFAFWLYSGPTFRLKGHPILCFFALAIGTILTMTFLGFIAAGGNQINALLIIASIGSGLVVMSMYPFSQIYQIEEDEARGDTTFTVKYGVAGVKKVFKMFFVPGIILLSLSLKNIPIASMLFLIVGLLASIFIWRKIKTIKGEVSEYETIMHTKYFGGLLFTVFVLVLLIIKNI